MSSSRFLYSSMSQDIQYEILGHMDAKQLQDMIAAGSSLASKELLLWFTSILVQYGLDPLQFRACMKTCDAMVSGSTALAVILPRAVSFLPNDIDVYVGSQRLPDLMQFLLTRTPYTKETVVARVSRVDDNYSVLVNGTGILSIRLLRDAASGRGLNVIESSTRSPLPLVWAFHSTVVMNVILHSGVGSAYPCHALKGIGLINSIRGNAINRPSLLRALDKYRHRGFRLVTTLTELFATQDSALLDLPALAWHNCGSWAYCPKTPRDSLDDGMLWVPFPEHTCDTIRREIPSVAWRLAHNGKCARISFPCPGWLEDVDGRRFCIVTGF